ncbi:Ku protein [Altererythrobacter aurantiacus]|uniref:Non-homologous end joining protein Ku n=1 Tax=Parapontixanthobacter aurantiacus TaxID=1463599 RepID=A0A844ZF23_9SPHN|nr:Ku protein [Parapontixanthobacter aurantiacus]MXO86378.1 Ku protein [Parapontixanthobacter aurantiacus]
MAARAYWQGQIRLALVSIPVEAYSAVKSGAKISFNQIHEPSGKRIRYEKVADGVGPVDRDDIVKGYEMSKGNYVLLDEEEIEAVKIESKKTLELVQFVEAHEIDPLYFERPYYIAPADDLAEEAFVVLREALRKAKKVGLGQLSVRGSEKLVAIKPCGKGLLMETLRYADEVRQGQSFFEDIEESKPDKELLELATTLIDKKTAPFDASEFEDRYADALMKLIEKKAKAKGGKKILEDVDEPDGKAKSNVIDLMAALKQSVDEGGKKSSTKKAASSSRKRKSA